MELLWRFTLARSKQNFRMLFNSPLFLYGFLPATLCLFWIAHSRLGVRAAQWVLLTASCVFYGAWDWHYLAMLLVLLAINFYLGGLLARRPSVAALSGGIAFNLLVLGYFKYTDFFIGNLNAVTSAQYPLLHVILPLGMSFFIFQKIAYLVDCHKGLVVDRDPLQFSADRRARRGRGACGSGRPCGEIADGGDFLPFIRARIKALCRDRPIRQRRGNPLYHRSDETAERN